VFLKNLSSYEPRTGCARGFALSPLLGAVLDTIGSVAALGDTGDFPEQALSATAVRLATMIAVVRRFICGLL
jgi:hypothetical protein